MKYRLTASVALTVLGVCLLQGCGNSNLKAMKLPPWIPKVATWPELDQLDRDPTMAGGLERIMKSLEEGDSDIGAYIQTLFTAGGFGDRLKKFEDTPIPAEFELPEREAAKKEYAGAWRELEKVGKKGADPKKIKALIAGMNKLKAKVQYIPNQQVPTGSEAAKYSAVMPYPNPYDK